MTTSSSSRTPVGCWGARSSSRRSRRINWRCCWPPSRATALTKVRAFLCRVRPRAIRTINSTSSSITAAGRIVIIPVIFISAAIVTIGTIAPADITARPPSRTIRRAAAPRRRIPRPRRRWDRRETAAVSSCRWEDRRPRGAPARQATRTCSAARSGGGRISSTPRSSRDYLCVIPLKIPYTYAATLTTGVGSADPVSQLVFALFLS